MRRVLVQQEWKRPKPWFEPALPGNRMINGPSVAMLTTGTPCGQHRLLLA
jgi:hypothetical protein